MAANQTWRLTYQGKDYMFDPFADLTISKLRQVKAWFPELGRFTRFFSAFVEGDPDALACALWVVGKGAIPEPNNITDMPVWEAITVNTAEAEAEADPTLPTEPVSAGPGTDPTPDSTPTSTDSPDSTSST